MPDFKPPDYIASLIQAINDGAKTAQTGALALAALGFYLMAASFSTSDLDLLLDHTTSISQLGLQVAPQAVFGVAPLVFLALHVFTLVRYDMLSANLRFLRNELAPLPDEDQERCRQLLANVEFIMGAIAPRTSQLYSWLFRWVWLFTIAGFPILVILVVQIFSMRYQSTSIIWAQRLALGGDFIILIWFFWRTNPDRNEAAGLRQIRPANLHRFIWRSKQLWLPAFIIMLLSFAWIRVPGDQADILDFWTAGHMQHIQPRKLVQQPFDNFLCPEYRWGCRYLDGSTQTLVGQFFPNEMAQINQTSRHEPAEEGMVAGVFLRGRSLKYADFYKADLTNADLSFTDLNRANLNDAYLNGAELWSAVAIGASIVNADLTDADLIDANFSNANLDQINLSWANLQHANLSGAHLYDAELNGAVAWGAVFMRADLNDAHLIRADLTAADLSNAVLTDANLSSSVLGLANLSGADLDGANLQNASIDPQTDFSDAKYTAYDSIVFCKTLFPAGFGDPAKLHGMIADKLDQPPAPNFACPDYVPPKQSSTTPQLQQPAKPR